MLACWMIGTSLVKQALSASMFSGFVAIDSA